MPNNRDAIEPELSQALSDLPREQMPGRLLEERIVRSLRARGLLRATRFSPSWSLAAAAAALALFAGGFAAGQWAATRAVASAVIARQDQTAMAAAQMVQRTGSAYVMALATLVSVADSAPNGALEQGREAAKAALYAAAGEIVTLAPDDPIAAQIRRYLSGLATPLESDDRAESRNVVWF